MLRTRASSTRRLGPAEHVAQADAAAAALPRFDGAGPDPGRQADLDHDAGSRGRWRRIKPDPPLFPADDGAEAWADSVLPDGIRQLGRYGAAKDPEAISSFLAGPLLGIPERHVRKAMPVMRPVVALQLRQSDETAKTCLEALPGQLDRVDALLEEGVIGGERPNAVDFQVAPSVRLMLNFDRCARTSRSGPQDGMHARWSRTIPGACGKSSLHRGFPSETRPDPAGRARRLALAPRGRDGRRRARPWAVGGARPAPAGLRRALRRGRPRRPAVRLPPLRRERRRAAPAARHPAPARGLAHGAGARARAGRRAARSASSAPPSAVGTRSRSRPSRPRWPRSSLSAR